VAAGAGGDQRNSGLPCDAGKEALEDDMALPPGDTPHPPGFHRLDVIRNRIGGKIEERE
jgi:hypothetical protein